LSRRRDQVDPRGHIVERLFLSRLTVSKVFSSSPNIFGHRSAAVADVTIRAALGMVLSTLPIRERVLDPAGARCHVDPAFPRLAAKAFVDRLGLVAEGCAGRNAWIRRVRGRVCAGFRLRIAMSVSTFAAWARAADNERKIGAFAWISLS
jgi:hypothetical protein